MRCHSGRLRDDGGIEIDDAITGIAEQTGNLAQQGPAVGTLVARIGVGKVAADVAQRGGTEQGVAKSVQQHIGIRVPVQTFFECNRHSADDQRPACDQRVYIESLSYSHVLPRINAASAKSP